MDNTLGYKVIINRLKNLLARERWNIVEEELAKKNHAELSLFIYHISTTKSSDARILQEWYQARPHSFYATIMYANYFINYAWDARGSGLASTVTQEMGMLFYQRLDQAHGLLEQAISINPSHPEPYSLSITVERAREYKGSSLIDDLNRIDKTHLAGQSSIITGLAVRWGGAKGEALNYVREVSKDEPAGSILHGLIAEAHIEVWMDFIEDLLAAKNYFIRKDVRHDLLSAYEKAFPNQLFRKDIDSILILNTFAFLY